MQAKTRTDIDATPERKRSFTETARRAQIIDEAIRTIGEVGYARASLAEIAQNLGISKGVISYHFASKAELIDEVVRTARDAGSAFMSQLVGEADTSAGKLRVYIASNVEFLRTHHAYAIALTEVYRAHPEDYEPVWRQGVDRLTELLESGQRSGEFRGFDSWLMAISIRAAIENIPPLMAAGYDVDLERYAQELVDLFEAATAVPRADIEGDSPGRGRGVGRIAAAVSGR